MEFVEGSVEQIDFECLDVGSAPAPPNGSDIEQAVRTLIAAAGDDPYREGLRDTPARVARAYGEWFSGYAVDPAELLRRVFTDAEDYEDTVLLRDIPFVSTCEHHLASIIGKAHVAYRPDGKVVGISKLSRLVDAFARRLQLQETDRPGCARPRGRAQAQGRRRHHRGKSRLHVDARRQSAWCVDGHQMLARRVQGKSGAQAGADGIDRPSWRLLSRPERS